MKKIKLTQNQYAIIDDDDFNWLKKFNWFAAKQRHEDTFYAKTYYFLMHREILQVEPGLQVDHINGNTLDNRKCNLRICTPAENSRNQKSRRTNTSSKYKGVTWNKRGRVYIARIVVNYKCIYLGSFKDELEAYKAYCIASKELHGDFSRLK